VGQRVTVRTASGLIPGVVGKAARHLLSEEERSRVPKVHDLWVDIGATDEADAASAVQIGDPIVMAAEPVELRGRRLASRALDNRLGALVVLEAARRAAAAGDLRAEVVAVASVREETSYTGARTAAYAIDPDIAITLDVTHTDDYPNANQARVTGSRSLGSGPSISRGAAQHEGIAQRLIAVAGAEGIPYTLEADGSASWTDSEAMQEVRAGIPCGLVGIPLRYMHSPSETCDLRDVEQAIDLVAHFCRSLAPGEDWTQ
jgi:putative aminopeptidase FrvX